MSRKDSKGMFAAVLGQLEDSNVTTEPQRHKVNSPHLMKVAAGVRELQERSELADRLLGGEHIIELDTDVILPSPIPDRFESAYTSRAIADIAESMRERGQIVPGMVRPVNGSQRFQIVYGRRRLAAAKLLGIKFKAVVRELSDEEAVVLQGEENAGREDLSFIEKCVFALAQETLGFRRETICASLATGKSHISEMIKIASAIPHEMLIKIGSAPSVGRGRWAEFAERYCSTGRAAQVADAAARPKFQELESDKRFDALNNLVAARIAHEMPRALALNSSQWRSGNGRLGMVAKGTPTGFTLQFKQQDASDFGKWLSANTEDLYSSFLKDSSKKNPGD